MPPNVSFEVSKLIRELREGAGLTQSELAERVGTTQSVISRLESDDYVGHSLSMLYRIGAALHRKIVVSAVGEEAMARGAAPASALARLQGAIKVGPGDVVRDVRRARAERGRDRAARS